MTGGAGVTGGGPVRGRAVRAAVLAGLNAGRIELSHCFTMFEDAFEVLPMPLISVVILLVADAKHADVPGTHFLIGGTLLTAMLILNLSLNGMAGMAMNLTMAREDGTLLRAKATPNGMIGLLTGKVVVISGIILLTVAGLLIVGLAPFSGVALGRAATWLTLAWVLPLGLLAMLSVGAVLGSVFPSVRSGTVMISGIFLLVGLSGIFTPVTQLPAWLQWTVQAFPVYWLGLGVRSALLPASLAAVEIGHSWRHLATAGALGAWAVAGLVVAPVLLRRAARRVSGSSVAARRERAISRAI
jgi:ABC-2 type transport system permease protein